jgi:ATP-dependent exoDNAse (exonuclease V) beta subunit
MALSEKEGVLNVTKPSKNQFFTRIEQALELNIEVIKQSLPNYVDSSREDAELVQAQAGQPYQLDIGSEQIDARLSLGDFVRFKQKTINELQSNYSSHRQLGENLLKDAANQGGAWQFASEDEALLGTVAHTWLQMMGVEQLAGWDEKRLLQGELLMRHQLMSAGYSEDKLEAAISELLQLLLNSLNNTQLRDILMNPQAQHEWPLHDVDGKLLIMDLVVPHEDYWHVIDFKSSRRWQDESIEDYFLRMRKEYLPQLKSYCAYLQAIDGRAAKASLFLMEEGLFVEVIS